ncbi:MAG: sulfatase, partial [Candidatus Nanohaloarchaea archaeon]
PPEKYVETNYSGILAKPKFALSYNVNNQSRVPALERIFMKNRSVYLATGGPDMMLGQGFSSYRKFLEPGTPLEKLEKKDLQYIRNQYYGDVEYSDDQVGRLISTLKAEGFYNNSIIVVVGDHGETLGRHGFGSKRIYFGHGAPYRGSVRVPLIVKVPGVEHRRIDTPTGLINVMPTVLDLAGIETGKRLEKSMQGQSLAPAILEGKEMDIGPVIGTEKEYIVTEKWHYLQKRGELYRRGDRYQQNELSDEYPQVVRRLERKLSKRHMANVRLQNEIY